MNPQQLAEAVVHWLGFEKLCGRADLFSEAALRMPVGQFLKTSQDRLVVPECDYPAPSTTRSKSLDYCLRRSSGLAISDAIEAKWIGSKARPTLAEEVFFDIYRLAVLSWPQAEPCNRWLLVAGIEKFLRAGIFDREFNIGDGRTSAFAEILPAQKTESPKRHRIYTIQGAPRVPHAELWRKAAEDISHTRLVSGIRSQLSGLFPESPKPDDFVCYVWRISRPQGCGERTITELFGS